MKYLYVKNGDAVDQLERIARADFNVSPNGPDAFIGSFLRKTRGSEVTLVSRGTRQADMAFENVRAHTRPGGRGTAAQVWQRTWFAMFLALKIVLVRPDRVICGSTGSQLLVCWVTCKLTGSPLVHSRHNSIREPGGTWLNRLRRSMDIFLMRHASAVVTHGPFLKAQLMSCGVDPTRLFEFEVSFPEVNFPNATRDAHAGPRLVLYVGRIEVGKGVIDLLQAAMPLFEGGLDFKLHFVGDGTAMHKLKSQIVAAGLQALVTAHGAVSHDKVMSLMQSATVIVTPTRTEFPEGRCMVALESIAVGVPVIAPNHGPFPYIVRHLQNGLLFESDNADSLQDCLRKVLTDDDLLRRLRNGAASASAELRAHQTDFAAALDHAFSSAALAQT